jgi:hypothetical protein
MRAPSHNRDVRHENLLKTVTSGTGITLLEGVSSQFCQVGCGGRMPGHAGLFEMSRLNPRQRAAVRYTDGPLLVLAGAGSGKSRVITPKIAHLIEKGLSPSTIAAVTFTNKAAREMQGRVRSLLRSSPARGDSESRPFMPWA